MAKVSIIIPVYNTEQFIGRSLKSLLDQTFEDIEYIIVDDCSSDRSIEIVGDLLDNYPHRKDQVKLVRLPNNRGSAFARLVGVENATGEFIIHIDSDDYCELNMIDELYAYAITTNADIVACDFYITSNGTDTVSLQRLPLERNVMLAAFLSGALFSSLCNKLIRLDLYHSHRECFHEGVNMCEDQLAVLELIANAKTVVYLNRPYLHYVQSNASSITKTISFNALQNLIAGVEIIGDFLQRHGLERELHQAFCFKKQTVLYQILRHATKEQRDLWRGLYPEARKDVCSNKTIPLYGRLVTWGSFYGVYFMADVLNLSIRLYNRIINMKNSLNYI